jgi:hypothetical protein
VVPASGSVAAIVPTTVFVAASSATLQLAPLKDGASFTFVIVMVNV